MLTSKEEIQAVKKGALYLDFVFLPLKRLTSWLIVPGSH